MFKSYRIYAQYHLGYRVIVPLLIALVPPLHVLLVLQASMVPSPARLSSVLPHLLQDVTQVEGGPVNILLTIKGKKWKYL